MRRIWWVVICSVYSLKRSMYPVEGVPAFETPRRPEHMPDAFCDLCVPGTHGVTNLQS